MIKVLSVLGTRPEAIKMGPVVRALNERPARFASKVCVTGQHRELLDQVLNLFQVVPDHDLDVMTPGQTLARLTAAVLEGVDAVLAVERPDWVLIQGDTTTAMAASLAAFYRGVKVGHVEAGLRTYDKHRPFPEEVNRRIATATADLHFAPTPQAAANLRREGVAPDAIRVTGNPVIDAVQWIASLDVEDEDRAASQGAPWEPPTEARSSAAAGVRPRLVLVTAHRRESFGPGLEQICAAIGDLAAQHPDVQIVYPVHPNPQVREPVHRLLGGVAGVTLLPPLDYRAFVRLIRRSVLVITDSGGLQEEAPGLGKPVLVLRDATERPEGVEAGTVQLVGTDRTRIVAAAGRLLADPTAYAAMARSVNPYGDGRAAARIVDALSEATPR